MVTHEIFHSPRQDQVLLSLFGSTYAHHLLGYDLRTQPLIRILTNLCKDCSQTYRTGICDEFGFFCIVVKICQGFCFSDSQMHFAVFTPHKGSVLSFQPVTWFGNACKVGDESGRHCTSILYLPGILRLSCTHYCFHT